MKDDREWLLKLFDEAMVEDNPCAMRRVMEVALQRLYGAYISVGDRERRLSHAAEVIDGYQKQLVWAWQFVPAEVIAQAEEQRRQDRDRIMRHLEQAQFDRIVADFEKDAS